MRLRIRPRNGQAPMTVVEKNQTASAFREHALGFEPESGSLIEEIRRLRDALHEQNIRFEIVLEKMRQGLCFFDSSKRLIVANKPYAELYGISPEAIRPGMELREIVDLRVAAGSVPAMTAAAYLRWREGVAAENDPLDSVVELRNGRVIRIHHEPLPDHGW